MYTIATTRTTWPPQCSRNSAAAPGFIFEPCSGPALHPGLKSLGFLHHSHHAIARVVTCALARDHVLLRHLVSER